jgi:hypothetical protein
MIPTQNGSYPLGEERAHKNVGSSIAQKITEPREEIIQML